MCISCSPLKVLFLQSSKSNPHIPSCCCSCSSSCVDLPSTVDAAFSPVLGCGALFWQWVWGKRKFGLEYAEHQNMEDWWNGRFLGKSSSLINISFIFFRHLYTQDHTAAECRIFLMCRLVIQAKKVVNKWHTYWETCTVILSCKIGS